MCVSDVRFFKGCIHAIFQTGSYQSSSTTQPFSIHKNKDIDLPGEIILYIPQWSLDVSIDIWYTQVIEFFCNKWKNSVLHCQRQQKGYYQENAEKLRQLETHSSLLNLTLTSEWSPSPNRESLFIPLPQYLFSSWHFTLFYQGWYSFSNNTIVSMSAKCLIRYSNI